MTTGVSHRSGRFDPLAHAIEGRVILPHHADYDEARTVWNAMVDRHPAAIARIARAEDVPPAIAFARDQGLPLALRGRGHNVAGNGTVDDGLVLDLGGLSDVVVDAERGTVGVGAGASLGEVDRAMEPFGLVVPLGIVSGTGVGGLTLGGGFGWLTRSHGLTIDALLEAEVITVDGDRIVATPDDNPDLFWALRGGGGNFGVVTRFTFRASPLGPEVFAGNFLYGRPRWGDALRAWARWTNQLPDEMTSIVSFLVPAPEWEIGEDRMMIVGFVWGDRDVSRAPGALEPLRGAAAPDIEVLEPVTWSAWQSSADSLFPRGVRAWWRNAALDHLPDEAIDGLVAAVGTLPRGTGADVHHMEGAFGRIPEEASAFPGRAARYWLNVYGFWPDPAEDEFAREAVRRTADAMLPYVLPAEYVNFLGADVSGEAATQKALRSYGPAKVERLRDVKRRYDPENVLRLNHNIPPD